MEPGSTKRDPGYRCATAISSSLLLGAIGDWHKREVLHRPL
jgi:hypothetical protein